jgi:putative two-component system response regulator
MNSDSTASIPNLLIVDDCPNSLELLASVLQDKGYRVQVVPSGERALEAALRQPPDLILLDILMPNLDGYEVCARLKTDVQLRRVHS